MAYFLYMVRCADDTVYTGITTDLSAGWPNITARAGQAERVPNIPAADGR